MVTVRFCKDSGPCKLSLDLRCQTPGRLPATGSDREAGDEGRIFLLFVTRTMPPLGKCMALLIL